MNAPKNVTANFAIDQMTLTVYSDHGQPNPTVGAHAYNFGTDVTASCGATPFYDPGDHRIRYVCTGWTGTGSVPASGGGTSTTFTITMDSTVTWLWKTQYLLETGVDPADGGTVDVTPSGGWYNDGTTVTLTATPNAGYVFTGWTGDYTGTQNPLSVTMDGPKSLMAHFSKATLVVDSAPGSGSCSPDVGTHTYDWGATVTLQANTPFTSGDNQYRCTGWTGPGAVPASGSAS